MLAAYLPGDRSIELRQVPRPRPGPGQVLLRVRASTICGSDLRAIYRQHLGTGAEAYQGVIGGHEPAGEVVELGEEVHRMAVGTRAVVYHISGCGQCDDCRTGYQISCSSARRRAYGWQRDGGHAEYLLADERDLLELPESLSFLDGACVACGFGTAYEALCRLEVSGRDEVLVVGLGPVGLAAGLLAKAMGASRVVGVDPSADRRELAAQVGAVDSAVGDSGLAAALPHGADAAIDCSGVGVGQVAALQHTRRWGRVAFVGEGGQLNVDVSEAIIHKQLRIFGSWVTSTHRMAQLLQRLDRWQMHPEVTITHRFGLADSDAAYRVADQGAGGKVAIEP
ncbi:MAG: zinc-dependent alcohol dehydrogenase family protein [Beutenbergiaceae bacterium]